MSNAEPGKWRFNAVRETDDTLYPLLLASAGGCTLSFERLYGHTSRRLFSVVLRVVPHRGEAEEVLQDVYLKVWRGSASFDPARGMVMYWLVSIAHRAAVDCYRRASSRPRELAGGHTDDSDAYDAFASSESGPVDLCETAQRHRQVHHQMRALPNEQQESLTLSYIEGLSHSEIATRLACPIGTIKSRVRRALLALRPAMQGL